MKSINQWLAFAGITALCLSSHNLMAQDAPPGGRGNRGNFDPAQMQQRMNEMVRERLEIKDDTEWKAIEPLVTKVNELRREQIGGMGRGMMGGRNRGGDQATQGGNSNRTRIGGEPTAEETALTTAVEANASKEELKAKMEAYRKVKAAKEAELKTAQANLKKVLTTKQEAIALQMGLVQ
jgi:hypothetical protein